MFFTRLSFMFLFFISCSALLARPPMEGDIPLKYRKAACQCAYGPYKAPKGWTNPYNRGLTFEERLEISCPEGSLFFRTVASRYNGPATIYCFGPCVDELEKDPDVCN